jgi:hypothetical protein
MAVLTEDESEELGYGGLLTAIHKQTNGEEER